MARQTVRKQNLKTFVGGLQTESNPLSYPDNTLVSGDNIDILRNGTARRRRSIDIETGGGFSDVTISEENLRTNAYSVHEWRSVGGDDTLNFTVVQTGEVLHFYKAGATALSLSHMGSISLGIIAINGKVATTPIRTDYGRGKLFIVSEGISPCYIDYDTEEEVFRGVKISLLIRDLDGISEDIESPIIFDNDVTPPDPRDLPYPFYDPLDGLSLGDYSDFSPFVPTINPPSPFIPIIDIDIGAL